MPSVSFSSQLNNPLAGMSRAIKLPESLVNQ